MPPQVSKVDGIERWTAERGEWSHWMAGAGVLCTRATGYITTDLASVIIATSTRVINQAIASAHAPRPHLFADWGEMTGYDREARALMTPWVQQMLPSTRSWTLLVSKAMVAMAINVANLELGGSLRVFNERAKYELALAEALHDPGKGR